MPLEGEAIARVGIDALNRKDIEAVLELCHPDIEMRPSVVGGLEGTVFRGREGYRRWFEEQLEAYEDVQFEIKQIKSAGDRVAVLFTFHVRGSQSRIELSGPGATVLTFQDGLVIRQRGFRTHEEALRDLEQGDDGGASGA